MSRWVKAGAMGNDEIATVRSGMDECTAVVYRNAGKFDGYAAVARVNHLASDYRRRGGWTASHNYSNMQTAKRDALRACGRMLRGLRG